MNWLLKVVADRLGSLLLADVALDFESEVATRYAERKAELMRRAEQYRGQGLEELADELQSQANEITFTKPLGSVLAAVKHWEATGNGVERTMLEPSGNGSGNGHGRLKKIEGPSAKKTTKKKVTMYSHRSKR